MLDDAGLNETAFLSLLARRLGRPQSLNYILLVPTLRCDLTCDYCQVSRAHATARGYDWSDETLQHTLALLSQLEGDSPQIEFQGGEPTLRMDLVETIVEYCRARFSAPRFVICTNLSHLTPALERLMQSDDVQISTSLDGPSPLHQAQRTKTKTATGRFLENLRTACRLAPGRVHALPTLDPEALPEPDALLDAYDGFGIRSIYLRAIVHHGFARKRQSVRLTDWRTFYEACIEAMIARNSDGAAPVFEESYLTLALKRLLRAGEDGHIDLRSPQWLGFDHIVIDYDGTIYPTDEARMLARSRICDLSIGHVAAGIDAEKRLALQGRAINALDPWCALCPYQAACGADPIDDIARYGRADAPRPATYFCQRHTHLFDFGVRLLADERESVRASVRAWLSLPASVSLVDRSP
jgi:His-Xaa-Ser system radical SAM maturase HxsB